jgi:ribA/ribD-fused uncharacterized protein
MCKSIAYECGDKVREDWEVIKKRVMLQALIYKFSSSSMLKTKLIATGSAKLIEHTAVDSYWGDGGGEVRGQNVLGALLEEVRVYLAMGGPLEIIWWTGREE